MQLATSQPQSPRFFVLDENSAHQQGCWDLGVTPTLGELLKKAKNLYGVSEEKVAVFVPTMKYPSLQMAKIEDVEKDQQFRTLSDLCQEYQKRFDKEGVSLHSVFVYWEDVTGYGDYSVKLIGQIPNAPGLNGQLAA